MPLFIAAQRFAIMMAMTQPNTQIRIATQPGQPNLSKGQKTFNSLIKKIETSRRALAHWLATVLAYQLKVASDYAPLVQTFKQLKVNMVHRLDQALDRGGLTKSEHKFVQKLICQVAEQLIADTADDALKQIYNKHSETDFDAEGAAAVDRMKATMESMFGVDLGDAADLNSPEALLAQFEEQMEKEHLQQLKEQAWRSNRKKTARQLAREEKIKAEEAQTSLSIREVYRKLVSALHPDREPDPQERTRKTTLMQRVNQAYEKKDLLQLLELQLELEQINAHTIAGLSEQRLKHFNKILEDQWAELEQEIAHLEMPLREQLNLPPYQRLMPEAVMPHLLRDIAELRRHIKQIQKEILVPNNPAAFKVWIRAHRRETKALEAQLRGDDESAFF